MEEIVIYTDGSHFKNGGSGRLGIGGLILANGELQDTFSIEIDRNLLERDFGTSDCSNPTMEFLAVLMALRKFGPQIKNKPVTMKMDYNGVIYWMTGKWKASKDYIKLIKEEIENEIKVLGLRGKIKFEWIKGHQSIFSPDSYWNNEVDKLAKGI